MSKSLKYFLFIAGGFVGLLVLVAVVTYLLVNARSKASWELVASNALGMEVQVEGPVAVRFLPRPGIKLVGVRVRNIASEIASAGELELDVQIIPLLHGEIRIERIALKHFSIFIEQALDGKFSFEGPAQTEQQSFPAMDGIKVSLQDGTLLYTNRQTGKSIQAGPCNLEMDHIQSPGSSHAGLLRGLSAMAEIMCNQIRTASLVMSDVKLSIDGKQGIFDLKPITMHLFGGLGSGSIHADFRGDVPEYEVHNSLSQFQLTEFFKAMSPKSAGTGLLDYAIDLSLSGTTTDELTRSADGDASVQGDGLELQIGDLDKGLANYKSSQKFNLVDVGAFFFAGPVGLAVTRGYNFSSILKDSSGSTHIRTLVSTWHVEHGVAQAIDVAMATGKNRIALQGQLDFVNEQFKDVTLAAVDPRGCAMITQKIHGAFDKPEMDSPNFLASIAAPAGRLVKKVEKVFGGKCDSFYAGSVAPPG